MNGDFDGISVSVCLLNVCVSVFFLVIIISNFSPFSNKINQSINQQSFLTTTIPSSSSSSSSLFLNFVINFWNKHFEYVYLIKPNQMNKSFGNLNFENSLFSVVSFSFRASSFSVWGLHFRPLQNTHTHNIIIEWKIPKRKTKLVASNQLKLSLRRMWTNWTEKNLHKN